MVEEEEEVVMKNL
jgi:hypothetical protein